MGYLGQSNSLYDPTRVTPTTVQVFSGNGSTTTFQLNFPVTLSTDVLVVVENVVQQPDYAYTVSNSMVVFTSPPPAGTNNIYVEFNRVTGLTGTVADGSITSSKLANNIRLLTTDQFVGNGNTTIYTLSDYPADANSLVVSVNGVIQSAPANYTVTTNKLTFTSAPASNTNIVIRNLGFRTTQTIYALQAGTQIVQPQIMGGSANNVTLNNATLNSANLVFTDSVQNTAAYTGFRNRIINGDMRIWQRGTSGFTTLGNYASDRWCVSGTVNSVVEQSTDVPIGFKYSLSITGSGYPQVFQRIESLNCTDLAGQSITISFWAKQTSGSGLNSLSLNTYYPTVTDNYTSVGSISGITFNGTTGWSKYTATITNLPSGVVNGLQILIYANTSGSATFLFTGVQLEKGSVATPFEFRSYGQELALCQRYYEKSYDVNIAPGTPNAGCYPFYVLSVANGAVYGTVPFKTIKRVSPTISIWSYAGTAGKWSSGDGIDMATGAVSPGWGQGVMSTGFTLQNLQGSTLSPPYSSVFGAWAASAEL